MENSKRTRWTDADVRCPFYIADDRRARSISCEGYDMGVEAVSRFRSLALKDQHMGDYCVKDFECCPVYRCTYRCKYAD